MDALGRKAFLQKFTGSCAATYAVYATSRYTYDFEDRLIQILHPDGASGTSFQYDMAGRKTGMSDPAIRLVRTHLVTRDIADSSIDVVVLAGYAVYRLLAQRPVDPGVPESNAYHIACAEASLRWVQRGLVINALRSRGREEARGLRLLH